MNQKDKEWVWDIVDRAVATERKAREAADISRGLLFDCPVCKKVTIALPARPHFPEDGDPERELHTSRECQTCYEHFRLQTSHKSYWVKEL